MQKKQILIEFGSNTTKLFFRSEINPLGSILVHPFRLADGLDEQNKLSSAMIDIMINIVNRTKAMSPDEELHLIGTQALRSANNQAEIVDRIHGATGLNLQILSPHDEARAAFLGIMAVSPIQGAMLSFDIGGASTELIFGKNGELSQWKSYPFGAVSLSKDSQIDSSFEERISRIMPKNIVEQIMPPDVESFSLVGCGGSVNAALSIALAYQSQSYSEDAEHELSLAEITRQIELMAPLSTDEIAAIPGMEPDRADIMPAALSIIRYIMDASHKESFIVSDGGVRQGYFLL